MKATKATPTLALLGALLETRFGAFMKMILDDKSTVVVIELLFPFRPRVRRGLLPVRKTISCPTASVRNMVMANFPMVMANTKSELNHVRLEDQIERCSMRTKSSYQMQKH